MRLIILAALSAILASAQTSIIGGGRDIEGAVRIAGATHTVREVASLPATCTAASGAFFGEAVILTADDSLHYCSATNVWTQISGAGGGAAALNDLSDVTLTSPTSGQFLAFGTDWANRVIAAGDLPAGHVDALTDLAGALCGTGEILEDQGAAWACIATPSGGGGSGDVVGPATSIDNAFARFDLTTGKLLQDSTSTLSDTGDAVFAGSVTATELNVGGTGPAVFGGNQLPAATGLADPPVGEYSLSVLDTGALATRIAGVVQRTYPDLTQILAIPGGTGMVAHTGSGATSARTVTAGDSLLSVANGDGVAGNPTVSVTTPSGTGTSLVTTTGAQTLGDCVTIDANGNHVAAGAACGSGGGGGAGWTWDAIRLANSNAAGSFVTGDTFRMSASAQFDEPTNNFNVTSSASDVIARPRFLEFTGDDIVNSQAMGFWSPVPPNWDSTTAIRVTVQGGELRDAITPTDVRVRVFLGCPGGSIVTAFDLGAAALIEQTTTIQDRVIVTLLDGTATPAATGCSPGGMLFVGLVRDHKHIDDVYTGTLDMTTALVGYQLQ